MCLALGFPKTKEDCEKIRNSPLKATEDILVYKVLTDEDLAPYKRTQYTKGRTHEVNNFSFNQKYWNLAMCWSLTIEQGFHSFKNKRFADDLLFIRGLGNKVVTMIIPKGTLYYESEDGREYVSLKLKY